MSCYRDIKIVFGPVIPHGNAAFVCAEDFYITQIPTTLVVHTGFTFV